MNLFKANIFSLGLFKQVKYLASTPQRAQKVVRVWEVGILSVERQPMHTGYMSAVNEYMSWAAPHPLKINLTKFGVPVQDASVFLITERSFMPLDPMGNLKPKDKEKIASLKDIAKTRHAIARARATDNSGGRTPLMDVVVYGSLILIGLCILSALVLKGCG